MSDLEKRARSIQKMCSLGTNSYQGANDLHADCHQIIGELCQRIEALEAQLSEMAQHLQPGVGWDGTRLHGQLNHDLIMPPAQTKPCTLCGQPITGVLYGREARHAVCPVSAWIPVGESLPPPGVDVLIVVSYEGVTRASISSIDGPWDSTVTHWMPLPPLPLRAPRRGSNE